LSCAINKEGGFVMRANGRPTFPYPLIPVIAALVALASCSDSTGPQWEFAGVQQVRVFLVTMEESIASADTLAIALSGDTRPGGQLSLNRIEAVRESGQVELTVWTDVERWVGSGTVPPYAVTIDCEYLALPPFDAGNFHVVIHQPDGSQLVDSVLVGP